jgi:hypothetical protein
MFRAALCPSSGVNDYISDYHMDRLILMLLMVGWPANLHLTTNHQQPKLGGPCGNPRYSREFLMMGIVLPETS